ncbi:glycoside hydrolase family 32 protein [Oceanobacillus timonensis]|uniref:glycoside hydrolase family 32 protein n=1 Tax=Oceanobacillus timonensis TaxID=1926285 RepID=UPI0015C427A7|nr:glycoside hydrolase family 32 protein [Oceanobacillus timonensis]
MTQHKTHFEQLARANQAVTDTKHEQKEASYRLHYHFMAPTGWLNDPNGLIQHNGVYHLFYQFNPYSYHWGAMHWGHATSRDLVNWKHEPVALAPSEPYEYDETKSEMGCFSGSAVMNGDVMMLFYTGHLEGHDPKEVQAIATSTDGIHFTKHAANPVINGSPEGLSDEFRDPKVWKHGELWYMVVGTAVGHDGAVALYKSSNLIDWEYVGIAAKSDGTQGDMWECPDLFPLGDKYVLMTSPMNTDRGKSTVMVGSMDYDKGVFIPESQHEIDYGIDFYAAQTFEDEKGRRILFAWMDFPFTEFPSKTDKWSGAMTIPRELTLGKDGYVRSQPVPELTALRDNHMHDDKLVLSEDETHPLHADYPFQHSYELKCKWVLPENKADGKVGLHLRQSKDGSEQTTVFYDLATNEVIVDTTHAGKLSHKAVNKAGLLHKNDEVTFHIFVDTCSVEVFVNDGEATLSTRIYPDLASNDITLYTEGTGATAEYIDIWELKNAEMS